MSITPAKTNPHAAFYNIMLIPTIDEFLLRVESPLHLLSLPLLPLQLLPHGGQVAAEGGELGLVLAV